MKTLPLLLVATCLTLSAQTEEQINKSFTVPVNSQLIVDVGQGSLEVISHAGNAVVISAFRKVTRKTKADEEAFLHDHPVIFSQEGGELTIQTKDSNNGSVWSFFGSNHTEAKYLITVPTTFNVRLKTSGGSIAVSNVTGKVISNTSGGGLRFTGVHGPLDGNTSGGGIRVTDCEGPVKIHTSGGGIEVTGGGGSLDGDTSGGGVTVRNFRGSAHVETSGGGINLENIVGPIEGSTSGGSINAQFSLPLVDEVKLETSGGGVTIRVVESSAFNLDAATSSGDVNTDLPITVVGKIGRGHLSGSVNGGGKPVFLRSSGGGINVRKL